MSKMANKLRFYTKPHIKTESVDYTSKKDTFVFFTPIFLRIIL